MSNLSELKDELNLLADNFSNGALKPGEFEMGVRGVAAELGARTEPLPEQALPVASDAHAVLEMIYATLLSAEDDYESIGRLSRDWHERIEEALGEDVLDRIRAEVAESNSFASEE